MFSAVSRMYRLALVMLLVCTVVVTSQESPARGESTESSIKFPSWSLMKTSDVYLEIRENGDVMLHAKSMGKVPQNYVDKLYLCCY